ncbi:MAG: class I SAM-dependent methyltransferase [Ornithinimicrobium sp.]
MTSRWQDITDDESVAGYEARVQERLADVRSAGASEHAEAHRVATLLPRGGRVLDAGCGTGRVARRLAERGYAVTGVDSDPRMLAIARQHRGEQIRGEQAGRVDYVEADLAAYRGETVDLVLVAGNVIALLAPGTVRATFLALVGHLRPNGWLLSGYGLDADHLPDGCPVPSIADVDGDADAAGLRLRHRSGTWEGRPFTGDYVVDVWSRA